MTTYCSFLNYFTIFILLFSFVTSSHDLHCKNEENRKVDWFVNYKIPKIEKGFPGSYLSEGKAYTYITSSKPANWKLSSKSITSNSSMLGLTMQNLIHIHKRASYVFYNDEPPSGFNGSTSGHLKGIVAFDGKSGFWLIHSIPKFGNIGSYEYPDNALSNGQSILCITFRAPVINDICKQLLFSHPKIYEYGITNEVLEFLNNKTRTIFTDKPAFVHKPPFKNTAILKSLNREFFISFAKDNQLKEDIYSQTVAPSLGTSLATETWRRGSGTYLPPSCDSKYSVLNVKSINMSVDNINIFFKSTEDHSKWAVSANSSQHWVCIGDMNRMESQAKRGGGTVCFQSPAVWEAYFSIISETDKCPEQIQN